MQGCQLHGFLTKLGCFENGVAGVNLKDAGHGFLGYFQNPPQKQLGCNMYCIIFMKTQSEQQSHSHNVK